MNRTAGYCILAAAVAAAAIDCGAAARADGGVKLVNYGSYLPGLEDLATNVAAYEAEAPFDGAMFHIASSSAVFSHKPYTPEDRAEIEAAAKVYASIPFRKWSFNFLGVLIDQDCPDWFDDAYWAMVTTNWVEVAKLAKRLRMVGVCLDSEGYGVFPMNSYWTSDWWLRNRGGKGAPTRDAYRAAARRRGRQVGEALFGTYPDCILWCLYAWSLGGDLTGAFFNGLVETMPPRARLADGDEWLGYTANGEPSYAEMAARNASGCGTLDPALKAKHDAQGGLAVGVYRANNRDGFRRANGWSRMMHGWYEGVYNMEALAAAFFDRGSPDEAAKVYDAWADFDGDRLPVGLRQQRLNAKVDAFRSRGLDISAFEKEYMTGLRRTTTEGADCLERGRAKLRLAAELRAGKSVDGRLADIFEVIDDRMAATDLRCKAARTIPEVCADGGATNWTKVAAATLRALKAGDWSGQWRTTYHRGNETDLRLDTLLLAVEAMAKAGERARAAKLLEEGAAAIGYTADATAESLDGQPNEDFARRVAKLDEAMAKLGVRRR